MSKNTNMRHKIPLNTLSHEHLDVVVLKATGEYPGAGLLLVECENGQWYVEVDFGDQFDTVDGIFKPDISPDLPEFFDSRHAAITFACIVLKKIHPEIADQDLALYFNDE